MKILDIIKELNKDFPQSDESYFEHFLNTLGVEDDSKLSVISIGMSKLLQTNLSLEDKALAELFLSVVNTLNSLLPLINADNKVLMPWFKNQVMACNLKQFNDKLNDFRALYTPELIALFRESAAKTQNVGYAPFTKINDTGITRYIGALKTAANSTGLEAIGLCFTTSKEDLVSCTGRKQYPDSPFYPFIMNKSSVLYDKAYDKKDSTLFEEGIQAEVPLLIKRG